MVGGGWKRYGDRTKVDFRIWAQLKTNVDFRFLSERKNLTHSHTRTCFRERLRERERELHTEIGRHPPYKSYTTESRNPCFSILLLPHFSCLFAFRLILEMEIGGVLPLRNMPEEIGGFDLSPAQSEEEAHVLVVDDSLVDRKVIERLLKISSCKGLYIDVFSFFLSFSFAFSHEVLFRF